MKNYNIVVFFLLILNVTYSQQTPVFSEYHFNPFLVNSAYAGLTAKEINATHNGSFGGFDGAPQTSSLTFTSDVPYQTIGYGFGVINDEIGVTKSTSVYGVFTARIEFDHAERRADWEIYDMHVLSFGLNAGVQFYRDDLLSLAIETDPNFNANINIVIPTIGASIIYNRANFFVGFSSPNLIGTSLANTSLIELNSQWYGYSGFRFFADKFEKILLKPSILVKYQNGAPLQTDFNLSAVYENLFELGLGYRTTAALNAFISFKIKEQFKVITSYSWATNNNPINSRYGIGLKYFVEAK